ncbi:LOW QUALITY PROTEIN: prosaposin-like [Lethenteron reissneri]|uniref:LOW QUALITY PROTEIN: prosaposin-like n=1 Tax=Lethenteron reissneri TaxID=7753 RepID=UPI002AB6795A|nr:LOW QUALITY PROTEIN: prosaposin-like [Lethenteron reissneri]
MVGLAVLLSLGLSEFGGAGVNAAPQKCTYGPSYWCRDLRSATECSAVQHCAQTVWNKPTANNQLCDTCKEVVTVVRDMMLGSATEAQLKAYLESACSMMSDPGLSFRVPEVGGQLPGQCFGHAQASDGPSVVCTALNICKTQQSVNEHRISTNDIPVPEVPILEMLEEKLKKGNGDVCHDCVAFLKDVQDLIKKNRSYADALIDAVSKQCDMLGPDMSDVCKQYVSAYADQMVQMFMGSSPEVLCGGVGVCSKAKHSPLLSLTPALSIKQSRVPSLKGGPNCVICEFVMEKLEELIGNNKSEAAIVKDLELVCSHLPSTIASECKEFVDTYGRAAIELLVQELDAGTVCTFLGLCKSEARQLALARVMPAKLAGGTFCEACKLLVSYLDSMLGQNATKEQIEQALETVCSFLPDAFQQQCDSLVEQYGELLVQLLEQALDPDFVCNKLGACIAARHATPLGLEECTWGPSFWCQSKENAQRCSAEEHCKRHVWN